ncbi:MAG: LamG-like jellyroll fold domain-containing protein [Halorientalis sp.]
MRRQFTNDTRGVRTVITHVMAIGIVSVLIVGLILSAGSYLTSQKESAARHELRTVGNRLADEITQLDRLSVHGGNATMRASHPDRISGSSYNARIATGSACDTPSFTSKSCLVIWSDQLDVSQKIPLETSPKTDLSVTQVDPGQFKLASTVTGGPSKQVRRAGITELAMRVGVGRDVSPVMNGRIVNPSNSKPIPKFTFEPGSPDNGTAVTFNATASTDLDGTIIEYRWDFDHSQAGPERVTSNPTTTWNFNKPGYRNVTLTVVDDDAAKSSLIKHLSISGLVYKHDLKTRSSSDSVEFTLHNDWPSRSVTITSMRIDPKNDNIDGLHDVSLSGDNYDSQDTSSETIPNGGLIVDGLHVNVGADNTVTIKLNGFDNQYGGSASMDKEPLEVAIRHSVPAQQTNTTVFHDVIDGPVISNYKLSSAGSGVKLSFTSSEQLSKINVDLNGDADGNYGSPGQDIDLTRSDFTESTVSGSYKYEVTLTGSGSPGTYVARLESVESTDGTAARNVPQTDSYTVSRGLVWKTAADWDNAVSQSGLAHANFGDHQANQLQIGYPKFDQWGSSLLTYYPFDDSGSVANDVTGNGHDATVSGAFHNPYGVLGDAYFFRWNTGIIEDSDAENYLNGQDALTISAWVKPVTTWNDMGILDGETPSGHDRTISLRHDSNGITSGCNDCYKAGVTTSDNGETNIESSSFTQSSGSSTNPWNHVVMTWDGSTGDMKLYFDGHQDTVSHTSGTGTLTGINTLLIGKGPKDTGSNDGWYGQIDEVRIYDRVLSHSQIQALYDSRYNGRMTTDWKSTGSSLQPNQLKLKYSAEIGHTEHVKVKVEADTNGDGTPDGGSSHWVYLDHGDSGAGVKDIQQNGLPASSRYRLVVSLSTGGTDGPSVNRLELGT